MVGQPQNSACGWVYCGEVWGFLKCVIFGVYLFHIYPEILICVILTHHFKWYLKNHSVQVPSYSVPNYQISDGTHRAGYSLRFSASHLSAIPCKQTMKAVLSRNGKFGGVLFGGSLLQKATVTKCLRWLHLF